MKRQYATLLLVAAALAGCDRMSQQELQSGYVRCADELELRTREMIQMRDELSVIWEFAIEHDRNKRMSAAFRFYHENDAEQRLVNMQKAVESIRNELQNLGRYSTDPTHAQWHNDLAEIFAMFERGVTNTKDGQGSSLKSFREETEKFRVELMTKLSTLSITLKVPTK